MTRRPNIIIIFLADYPDQAAYLRRELAEWEQDVDTSYRSSRSKT